MIEKKDLWVTNGENQIYGEIYLPGSEEETYPLVIFSHELGADHTTGTIYAMRLAAKGYAVYLYDFCGGSKYKNKSSRESTDMSVLTEKSDLEAVIEAAKGWPFADMDRLVLMGASQGGFVTVLAAADMPALPKALVLLYPALHIQEECHRQFESKENVPERYELFTIPIGGRYALDAWEQDPYEKMSCYNGPVLLLHGDEDMLINASYSERAQKTYPNARLKIIKGGKHGFDGEKMLEAAELIRGFLLEHVPPNRKD